MRTFLKILIGLLVLITLSLFIFLDEVDFTPYFTADYYESTCERLEKEASEAKLSRGAIQLGFSKMNITPSLGTTNQAGVFAAIPMAGYGDREGASVEGVRDSLYVSSVALKVGEELRILLSADLLIIPPLISEEVARQMKEKHGLTRNQLFFSATHTHASIGAWSDRYVGELFAGKLNPSLIQWLSDLFVASIEEAVEDMKPGALGLGSFQAPTYVKNRVIGDKGEEDGEFVLMRLAQKEGKTALLGSFDAHATILPGSNMEFSADYPGYWRSALLEKGIDYPIFFAGSVGSHGPEMEGQTFGDAARMGQELADSVWKYFADIPLKDSTKLASLTLELDLPEFQVRVSDGVNLAPYFGKQLFPALGKVHIQAMRIGNLIWATAPADFSGEMAIDLKNAMYRKGFYSHVTSFNGAYVGYIVPPKYFHYDGYESRMMSWFGPGMGPYMEEMLRRSMEHVSTLK